ncbi:MAG: DUF4236 domain-containing protein [Burkholderiales bacterium]|nr:DUF4236 domain-containing protein [Burkholderiales bacterium]MDE2566265.1 DUF4236 domain-containing protein [Burkholderiales bacterium]
MGFRFRRTIRLFKGLRLNVSKGGVSVSVGEPGATVNMSKRGTKTTASLPGTGLSYSSQSRRTKPAKPEVKLEPKPTDRVSPRFKAKLLMYVLWAVLLLSLMARRG